MIMSKRYISLGFVMLWAAVVQAQDFHYSMFYSSPLTVNPACTGIFNGDVRTANNYRMQWASVTRAFKTMSLSVDAPIFKKKMKSEDFFAAGFVFNNDNVGSPSLKTNMYNGSVSYTKFLGGKKNSYISTGFQVGYCTRVISLGGLQWDSQFNGNYYDPSLPSGEAGGGASAFLDYSAGMLWNFKVSPYFQGYLGGAAFHLTRPSFGFVSGDRIYRKYVGHAAMNIEIRNTNTTLVPNALVAFQGPTRLIDFGLNFKYALQERSRYTGYQEAKYITFGIAHRWRDALMGSVRYDWGPVGVGFSYDVNISRLIPATTLRGGMEFLVVYTGLYGDMKNTRLANPRFM